MYNRKKFIQMVAQSFKFLIRSFLDFVFISNCELCGKYLEDSRLMICKECFGRIERVNRFDIEKKFEERFDYGFINKAFSCFHFEENTIIQKLIHELKYNNKRSIGKILGEILGSSIKDEHDFITADAILPVPLHKLRMRERGYNQSELIANGVSKVIGVKVISDLLVRVKNTQTQTKLNFYERRENVKDAFKVKNKYNSYIVGRKFIIVDDVITTGSTIVECAKVLKQKGAEKVYAISVAVA